jgi:hypothetical protein
MIPEIFLWEFGMRFPPIYLPINYQHMSQKINKFSRNKGNILFGWQSEKEMGLLGNKDSTDLFKGS